MNDYRFVAKGSDDQLIPLLHQLGDWVHLDGDDTLRYRIVGIQIYERGNQYLCAWVKPSGDHDERWFDEWRLTRFDR